LLGRVRGFLRIILLLGLLGTLAELLIAQHTEDAWQWVPLILLGAALVALAWHALAQDSRAAVRFLRALMVLFLLAGFAGIGLHMKGKMEFKQESDPSLHGWRLAIASLESKTPPPLAPGVMIQMGLLGLVYASGLPAPKKPPTN